MRVQVSSWLSLVWKLLINLNLYETPTRNEQRIYRQRMTTRLFIVSMIACFATMSVYMIASVRSNTIVAQNPSQSDYERLHNNYSSTLRCVCSESIISYSDFVEIIPNYHQLCSSAFISSAWYNQLILKDRPQLLPFYSEWINIGSAYFQLLASFCSLVQNTINDTYRIFSAKKFVSSVVVPESSFLQEIQTEIDSYTQLTNVEFARSLSLVRSNIYINQFVPAVMTNMYFTVKPFSEIIMTEGTLSIPNPNNPNAYSYVCHCIAQGSRCAFYARFAHTSIWSASVPVTSLFIRCFPIDSVLTSTLECWYNQTCLSIVRGAYAFANVTNLADVSPLDAHAISRFPINTTMNTLVNELLLENWTTIISFKDFYKSCAPASCSYTVEERFDILFIVITTLSFYSGLAKGLRLISPLIILLALIIVRKYRKKKHTLAQPKTVNSAQTEG